jgi:hypothetical protein
VESGTGVEDVVAQLATSDDVLGPPPEAVSA